MKITRRMNSKKNNTPIHDQMIIISSRKALQISSAKTQNCPRTPVRKELGVFCLLIYNAKHKCAFMFVQSEHFWSGLNLKYLKANGEVQMLTVL